MAKQAQQDQQITAAEAAALLSVNARTVQRLFQRGKLPGRKLTDATNSPLRLSKAGVLVFLKSLQK